jgi:uncharacterized C2H2 Zn-finger protein
MNDRPDLASTWFSEFLANPTDHTSVVLPGPRDSFVLIEARSDTNGSVHVHARLIELPMSIAEIQSAISTLKPNMYREKRLVEQYIEAAEQSVQRMEDAHNHRVTPEMVATQPERVYTQPAHDEAKLEADRGGARSSGPYQVKKKRTYKQQDSPCPICQRVFPSVPAMRTHMWKKHPIEFAETLEAKKRAEAEEASNRRAEIVDQAKDTSEPDSIYQTLTMDEARARWLTTHPDTIYPEPEDIAAEDNYFCKVCGKVYAKENWLFRHLVKAHPEVDPYRVADLSQYATPSF